MKPKDDGMGLMGLGVNTHGIGFGKQLSDEGLKTINEFCKIHRPHYMDKDTAKKIKGDSLKQSIERGKSPCNMIFGCGTKSGAYWTYDHMILQLEDNVDVLDSLQLVPYDEIDSPHKVYVKNIVHRNSLVGLFQFLFLTDHSWGHNRKSKDGLDVLKLRKGPTASVPLVSNDKITEEVGVLSKAFDHEFKLMVGDTQKLVFGNQANFGNPERGPFYWSQENREKYKYNEIGQTTTKKMLVAELHNERDNFVKKCEKHKPHIPITIIIPEVAREGWHGKAKGVFHILWERGYIDPDQKKMCQLHVKGEPGRKLSLEEKHQLESSDS